MMNPLIHPGKMKVLALSAGGLLCSVLLFPAAAPSEINGQCADCHTMHNSQDGAPVTPDGLPRSFLGSFSGSTSCWGCHGRNTTFNIDPVTGSPQIRHTNAADLAGGNFAYITGDKARVTGDEHTVGHNVVDIHEVDRNFDSNFDDGTYPPGDVFSQLAAGFDKTAFTCAGRFGCHGDRTKPDVYLAMAGAHHTGDAVLKFGTIDESGQGIVVGSSYRFLLGVKGGEDSDWQATVGANDHNEYKGAVEAVSSPVATEPGGSTMSGLCAECHGNFHRTSGTGGASPWLRHPTDISLPADGEYANYLDYNPEAPVARTVIPNSPSPAVTPSSTTDDIVMCLSCHRPHASPFQDILRWSYEGMNAGAGPNASGCFICHTSKDE